MSNFGHPVIDTSRGKEPGLRKRLATTDPIKYVLVAEDVLRFPKFPLHSVAIKFFREESFWELLAEVNPIKDPSIWAVGDTVLIPRDWVTLIQSSSTSSDEAFRRKIY